MFIILATRYISAMQKEFWHERWQRNEIGFHRDSTHPALEKHWPTVALGKTDSVLVPLCGKSLDMLWLARQGHRVVGVELDRGAVEAFFDSAGLHPDTDDSGPLSAYSAGPITIFAGDFFEFDASSRFDLVYDRAALIALPHEMRVRYQRRLATLLSPGARGLLITLEYPDAAMQGPPFSVMPEELDGDHVEPRAFDFQCLERSGVLASQPRFADKGLPWLNEAVYTVTRR